MPSEGTHSGVAEVLDRFHPITATWFRERFREPTEPQREGWPAIAQGRDTLIAAPTGSGKTLAAFLSCLDGLIKRGVDGDLPEGTEVLYVSPLKALSNDIHRNLEKPLEEMRQVALRDGVLLPTITAAVRTGDTPASERQKMAKKPPHILVTTPESMYLLLTSKSGRKALSGVRTVIVDEIHAVADDKRGAHLTLSLERLDRLVTQSGNPAPVRVGLSATQRPIELIGRMLVGNRRDMPLIVDGGHAREIDVAIQITDDELGAVATHEQMARVFDAVADLVTSHETTIVFVNTRKMVERAAHQLEARLGEDAVVAHHGSLSRRIRLAAEQKLKSGQVRCAVATASLELGIDVGSVDLVVQIVSPRSIAVMLQRVGRSGHSLGKTPKGRLFPLTRDQLVECAALVRAVRALRLDAIIARPAPLDIMAQQIVAAAACEELGEDELLALIRGASHYDCLEDKDYAAVLRMLAEGVSDRRGRSMARIHHDRINGRIKARRGARLAALTSSGAIPDNANYAVVQYPEEIRVGDLDEDFAIESNAGDVFLLGNTSWRVRRVEAGRVLVEDAKGASPTVPFWLGEAPARTMELSEEVSALRAAVAERLEAGQSFAQIAAWVGPEALMSETAATQLVAYLAAGRAALGAMPTSTTIVAERFFDEAGGMQMILHAPLGGRINRAWGLALRKRFCRSFNFELQAAATDDGLILSLGEPHSFPLEDVFRFLNSSNVEEVLVQALLGAPMFGVRWRWNATRSLAVLRRNGGKRVAPHLLRMRSDDLLSVVFPMQQACLENVVGDIEPPDHPLVNETLRDCLTEAMDVDGLRDIIEGIERGAVQVVATDTVEPSPLCHELVNANPYAFLDDVGLEERRTRAVSLRRGLKIEGPEDIGALDSAAIAQAEEEARPPARDADELHDALLSLYVVREDPTAPWQKPWAGYLPGLIEAGRATRLHLTAGDTQTTLWVAAERLPVVQAAIAECTEDPDLPPLPFEVDVPSTEQAVERIVAAYLDHTGPRTSLEISAAVGVPVDQVEPALFTLEADGAILRGSFRRNALPKAERPLEWCNRRILARIHRLTLTRLRKQVEPVNAAALQRFLFRWHRLSKGNQLIGADGLLQLVEQLQGFETAAGAWEREVLPARLHAYDATWLDSLCLGGEIAWCRLSARQQGIKMAPTKAAPLAVMLRRDMSWLRAPRGADDDPAASLGEGARAVFDHLAANGASFLVDISEATGLAPLEVEEGLWELVARGLAHADGFSGLRVLVDKRRGERRSRFDSKRRPAPARSRKWQEALSKARARDYRRPSHAANALPTASGRWSLLPTPRADQLDAEAAARQLLHRYGVVFRDLLARESCLPPWREVLVALRRLEARGEIRGGRFVAGFVGEQFALPEAVEGLRAMRNKPNVPEITKVAATDPLNLVGVTSAGPRVPSVMGNAVLYRDGVPIASLEAGELVLRDRLEDGARVDEELQYYPPPRSPQSAPRTLPLFGDVPEHHN